MRRRSFLGGVVSGAAALAGCIGDSPPEPHLVTFETEVRREHGVAVADCYAEINNEGGDGNVELEIHSIGSDGERIETVDTALFWLDAGETGTYERTVEIPEETEEIEGVVSVGD